MPFEDVLIGEAKRVLPKVLLPAPDSNPRPFFNAHGLLWPLIEPPPLASLDEAMAARESIISEIGMATGSRPRFIECVPRHPHERILHVGSHSLANRLWTAHEKRILDRTAKNRALELMTWMLSDTPRRALARLFLHFLEVGDKEGLRRIMPLMRRAATMPPINTRRDRPDTWIIHIAPSP